MTARGSASPFPGLMMRQPLLVRTIAQRAEQLFERREIVSLTETGVERSTYGAVVARARRLASALHGLGIRRGDRVATFCWNSRRHLELYLAVPSMGAVLHTLNIRLFEDDLRFIVGHAEDRVIFLDASLADRLPRFDRVAYEVLMPDAATTREGALDYEELVAAGDPAFEFPDLDEDAAAAMCYSSGTTGRPKGVVYSHRSTVLHALISNQADAIGLRERDTVLPVVPMFHANAWGLPYSAALAGSRLAFPGSRTAPADLAHLIASERVTCAAAVPTVWQGVLELEPQPDLSSVERLICGGSAVPESLIRAFDERFKVPVIQAWGMTETSPLGSVCRLPADGPQTGDDAYAVRALQGRILPLVEFRTDEDAAGELQVRGPTVARAYYNDETASEQFTADGWLRTGDVVELQDGALIKVVDRAKDLVRSGGEWISSVELENVIMGHPDVLEAAVVAVLDERWGERPCAFVVRKEGSGLDPVSLCDYLTGRVARWWVPDRVEFIGEVPKTSVGKFDKKALRAQLNTGVDSGDGFAVAGSAGTSRPSVTSGD